MTQIKAKIAKRDSYLDGLSDDKVARHMLDHPNQPLVVVCIFDVVSSTKDFREGTEVPKVALRSSEVMTGGRALSARTAMEEEYAQRTGQVAPPLTLFDNPAEGAEDPAASAPAEGEVVDPPKPSRRRNKAENTE